MGGTFDPIHTGHLVAAEAARHAFDLQEVRFVPAGTPWQKEGRDVASADDRVAMAEVATADNPGFSVSRIEVDREGPTYTRDTLSAIHEADLDAELFFITGADAILQILTWKDPETVLALATFVAASRPGYDLANLDELIPASLRTRVQAFEVPALSISSTDIRARVRDGRPIRYLVPDSVADYITGRGLYR